MKTWVKVLIGAVAGGGAGFGVGYFFGKKKKETENKHMIIPKVTIPKSDDYELETIRASEKMEALLEEYRGSADEDVEMPMEPPVIDDEEEELDLLAEDPPEDPSDSEEETDIPQHHPENLLPHPISEEEYNENINGYDLADMVYYAENDGVYDPEYDELMPNPEQLLGYGWFALFSPTTDVIYIENDTMGTIYRIRYDHGSLEDSRGG